MTAVRSGRTAARKERAMQEGGGGGLCRAVAIACVVFRRRRNAGVVSEPARAVWYVYTSFCASTAAVRNQEFSYLFVPGCLGVRTVYMYERRPAGGYNVRTRIKCTIRVYVVMPS